MDGADEVSVQLDAGATDATLNDALTSWCPTPEAYTYGAMGRRGTPGAANPPCFAPAIVRINEVNANITQGCDLIELRVVRGGSLAGFRLTERDSTLIGFPGGFLVETHDLIVVHTNGDQVMCRGGGARPADETAAPDEVPRAAVSSNYDGAFDFYADDLGLTNTHNVFLVTDAEGAIVEALLAADDMSGTVVTSAEEDAADAAAAGEWTAPDGSVPAGGFVDDEFRAAAVRVLNGTGMTAAGESIQRDGDADMDHKDDWTQGASTWGALNAGQTPF